MSKCKDCFHYDVCSGFTPTDLDADVFDYCREGRADEIPDIEKRCNGFKHKADVVEVVRCKECIHKTITDDGEYNPEDIVCDYHMSDGFCENDFCSYGEKMDGKDGAE